MNQLTAVILFLSFENQTNSLLKVGHVLMGSQKSAVVGYVKCRFSYDTCRTALCSSNLHYWRAASCCLCIGAAAQNGCSRFFIQEDWDYSDMKRGFSTRRRDCKERNTWRSVSSGPLLAHSCFVMSITTTTPVGVTIEGDPEIQFSCLPGELYHPAQAGTQAAQNTGVGAELFHLRR